MYIFFAIFNYFPAFDYWPYYCQLPHHLLAYLACNNDLLHYELGCIHVRFPKGLKVHTPETY